ncbi:MAG TPA: phosphoribosyltransferase family protein [Stellaceae bacterium]|nr:phosphoribosyltransferase family protein [Stellaceae bacterium]
MTRFADRADAGRRLAAKLAPLAGTDVVVLALPRGGVAVGFEIAQALNAPLDLVLVRKIGAPGMPELAVAALVDAGGEVMRVVDEGVAGGVGLQPAYLDREAAREERELARRRAVYGGAGAPVPLFGRTAIVVDDGIATGTTMRAALLAIRRRDPARLILAVPVAPAAAIDALRSEVDEIVALETPEDFFAIGQFYGDFHQMSDGEVLALLERATRPTRY